MYSSNIENGEIQTKDTLEVDYYKSLTDSFSFEDYKVPEISGEKVSRLDLSDFKELPKDIIDKIKYHYDNQKCPNFAGHYIIISWSCGSPCQMNAIIDTRSGKTIQFINSGIGLEFQLDSYLIIINPPTEDKYDNSFRELIGPPDFKLLKKDKLIDL